MEPSLGLYRPAWLRPGGCSGRILGRPPSRYDRPPPARRTALCGGHDRAVTIRMLRAKSFPRRPSPRSSPGPPGRTPQGVARLCALPTYQRRQPEGSVLYCTVQASWTSCRTPAPTAPRIWCSIRLLD